MKNLKPKNRLAEVMAMFMQNKKTWLSHYDFALSLWQINSHKRIGDLKTHGITFEERTHTFENKFGRKSQIKQFRVKTPQATCLKVFNTINK